MDMDDKNEENVYYEKSTTYGERGSPKTSGSLGAGLGLAVNVGISNNNGNNRAEQSLVSKNVAPNSPSTAAALSRLAEALDKLRQVMFRICIIN